MMRYPKAYSPCPSPQPMLPLSWGKAFHAQVCRREGACPCGRTPRYTAAEVSDRLEKTGLSADVYNVRFLSSIDEYYLATLSAQFDGLVIMEDGVRTGGFGESVAAILAERGVNVKITACGVERNPLDQASRDELLARAGLDAKGIQKVLSEMLQSLEPSPQQVASTPGVARIGPRAVSGEVQHVR